MNRGLGQAVGHQNWHSCAVRAKMFCFCRSRVRIPTLHILLSSNFSKFLALLTIFSTTQLSFFFFTLIIYSPFRMFYACYMWCIGVISDGEHGVLRSLIYLLLCCRYALTHGCLSHACCTAHTRGPRKACRSADHAFSRPKKVQSVYHKWCHTAWGTVKHSLITHRGQGLYFTLSYSRAMSWTYVICGGISYLMSRRSYKHTLSYNMRWYLFCRWSINTLL